jgi:hypothetical protein
MPGPPRGGAAVKAVAHLPSAGGACRDGRKSPDQKSGQREQDNGSSNRHLDAPAYWLKASSA